MVNLKDELRARNQEMVELHKRKVVEEEQRAAKMLRLIEALPESDAYSKVTPGGFRCYGSVKIGTDNPSGYSARYKGFKTYKVEDVGRFMELLPPLPRVSVKDGWHKLYSEYMLDEKEKAAVEEGKVVPITPVVIDCWVVGPGNHHLNAQWYTLLRDEQGEFQAEVEVGLSGYPLPYQRTNGNDYRRGKEWYIPHGPMGANRSCPGGLNDSSLRCVWWWHRNYGRPDTANVAISDDTTDASYLAWKGY